MADEHLPPSRYAPAIALPPYGYVPGHDLPHPVNDPAGHLFAGERPSHEPPIAAGVIAGLPTAPVARRRALTAVLAANPRWRYALDLFNGGFSWEAHEAWEGFWLELGRTSPEARFVQGLIHLAAAAVKIREGKPAGVTRHARRARELLGDLAGADDRELLGLRATSLAALLDELDDYTPACWHTSRTPVVRVLVGWLRLADEGAA
jgi:predicted metal-dependent hydrolase